MSDSDFGGVISMHVHNLIALVRSSGVHLRLSAPAEGDFVWCKHATRESCLAIVAAWDSNAEAISADVLPSLDFALQNLMNT